MNQEWFEMTDLRRRKLHTAVWIPLRASDTLEEVGKIGYFGFRSEFFGAGSVAVPLDQKAIAEELTWVDVGIRLSHKGSVVEGRYVPADVFNEKGLNAIALVLQQDGNSEDLPEWHLHQDLVIALDLKREGDVWLAMNEGYVEVARLKRHDDRHAQPPRNSSRVSERLPVRTRNGPLCFVISQSRGNSN